MAADFTLCGTLEAVRQPCVRITLPALRAGRVILTIICHIGLGQDTGLRICGYVENRPF
jgi:hypothetical protein